MLTNCSTILLTIEPVSFCVSSLAIKKAGKNKKRKVSLRGRNLLNFINKFSNINSEFVKRSTFISWNARNINQFADYLSNFFPKRRIIFGKKQWDYILRKNTHSVKTGNLVCRRCKILLSCCFGRSWNISGKCWNKTLVASISNLINML